MIPGGTLFTYKSILYYKAFVKGAVHILCQPGENIIAGRGRNADLSNHAYHADIADGTDHAMPILLFTQDTLTSDHGTMVTMLMILKMLIMLVLLTMQAWLIMLIISTDNI